MKNKLQKIAFSIICFIRLNYQAFAGTPIITIVKATALSTTSVEVEYNIDLNGGVLNGIMSQRCDDNTFIGQSVVSSTQTISLPSTSGTYKYTYT